MHTEYLTAQQQKQKRNKAILIWAGAAILLGAFVFGVIKLADSSQKSIETRGNIPAMSAQDKVRGNRDAEVLIYEYADYQCPACQQTDPILQKILTDYPKDVALVYRNFPLKTIHSTAMISAAAAEAADRQGKFWQMHDLLYANQSTWENQPNAQDLFANYAQSLGMDVNKFKQDMNSQEITAKIQADYNEAVRLNLDHTPTIGLNGKLIENPVGYDGYKKIVEEALTK